MEGENVFPLKLRTAPLPPHVLELRPATMRRAPEFLLHPAEVNIAGATPRRRKPSLWKRLFGRAA